MLEICLDRKYLKILSLAFIFVCLVYFLITPPNAHAAETGFFYPTQCTTTGSNCNNMMRPDDLYNSWINAQSEEVIVSGFNQPLPENTIIDEVQIKMRIRTSTSGWTWFVHSSIDGVTYIPPVNCSTSSDVCRYNTGKQFNSVTEPTLIWKNNNPQHLATREDLLSESFRLKLWQSGGFKNTDIDYLLLNIVYHVDLPSTPTPTPTPIPSPTPEPFLDLPWDWQSTGKEFEEIVLDPNSWFDHQYPLQDIPCCTKGVLKFTGRDEKDNYRSHSGYDFGLRHGVSLHTPVLAAAAGWATYVPESKSGGGGEMIKIDHGNGYQTWYEHLDHKELIVHNETDKVYVEKGQKVGRVGLTGNVFGAHIHLSVFKDSNENGTFEDDYPYGLVDPLGWEGKETDPWESWGNETHHGAKSYSLFIARTSPVITQIPTIGGSVQTDTVTIFFPIDAVKSLTNIKFYNGPFAKQETLKSIGPSFSLNATNPSGDEIHTFEKPLSIDYSYANNDLFNVNEDTLRLFFFNNTINVWEALPTIVDKVNKNVHGTTDHFSEFAVMGEIADLTAPSTTAILSGEKGQEGWYRSSVEVKLQSIDNENGVGIGYTLYSTDGEHWQGYDMPLRFDNEGTYTIMFHSVDNAENVEDDQTITFHIDKVSPEAIIQFNTTTRDIDIIGRDTISQTTVTKSREKNNRQEVAITDMAGNTLKMRIKDKEHGNEERLSIESLQYNTGPLKTPLSNKLSIEYGLKKKTNIYEKFEQIWKVKDEIKLKLDYLPRENKTRLVIKDGKEKKQKETVDGMKVLQVFTENGTLKYSY